MEFFKKNYFALLFLISVNSAMVLSPENDNNLIFDKENRAIDARSLITSLLGNFLSPRSYSVGNGSQVVSINLTNLLVLVLLKALIFAAGTIGIGSFKEDYYHRKREESNPYISQEELLLFLSFMNGSPGNNGCLQQITCRNPDFAIKYKTAGETLLETTKMLDFEVDPRYDYTLREVQEAVDWAKAGKSCNKFECNVEDNNNDVHNT